MPPSAATYNVATESADPESILNFYKNLLALRRTEPALARGGYASVNPGDEHVFSFVRRNPGNGRSVLVALNMSAQPQTVSYDLSAQGVQGRVGLVLLANGLESKEVRLDRVQLPPFGVLIAGVQ